jgi:hypothetical protein
MAQIEKLWAQMPNANIGIATGAASGVFAFDVEDAAQFAGEEFFVLRKIIWIRRFRSFSS